MQKLEAYLGLKLLDRTTRSVAPTEAGERLLQGIGPRFEEIEAELTALNALREKPAGTIRINAGEHAAETILFDAGIAGALVPRIGRTLLDAGCEVRGCERTRSLLPEVKPATEQDWYTEYLDAIVAVRVVDGVEAAIDHINTYGSHHTDDLTFPSFGSFHMDSHRIPSHLPDFKTPIRKYAHTTFTNIKGCAFLRSFLIDV